MQYGLWTFACVSEVMKDKKFTYAFTIIDDVININAGGLMQYNDDAIELVAKC